MAKAAGGFNRRNLAIWFSRQNYQTQKDILGDLRQSFDEKDSEVERLKAKLAALTGESTSAPAVGPASRKPRNVAAEKAVNSATRGKRAIKAKRGTKPGTKVEPKYIDKATGTTWAGRGMKPAWVEAHLKKGGKLDDLLIAKKRGR